MSAIALISDIHANQEALEAVFADIDKRGDIDAVYCLGDVVGYGPSPEEVIDLLTERCEFTLLGNHDHALLNQPAGFNPIAAGAIACQRSFMEPGIFSFPRKQSRWNFLKNLPQEKKIGPDTFVHASPRDKIFEYILPEDTIYNREKLKAIFAQVERRCFVGHTHRPGIINEAMEWHTPEDLDMEYVFRGNEKALINVSSVGQPRDRNPKTCYAILTESSIRWIRLDYDVETTVRKVKEVDCLDEICGTRLLQGR